MPSNRRSRCFAALFAVLSLLFMQLAVAGYVCPSTAVEASSMVEAGMPCADTMAAEMDSEQPHLCHAHCQSEQQVSDKQELPAPVAVSMLSALPADFTVDLSPRPMAGPLLQASHLARTTTPPLAISHCCLRL